METMKSKTKELLVPFSLTAGIVALDQLTKLIVLLKVRPMSVGFSLFGDFFQIIHVYNPGIAFSIGGTLSDTLRSVLFGFLPLIVLAVVIWTYFRSPQFTRLQRWCIAGIVGGGLGNLLDRFFRPAGVLDFIDVKFFGIFGWARWPTFNIADSSVVVCGIILVVSVFLQAREEQASNE